MKKATKIGPKLIDATFAVVFPSFLGIMFHQNPATIAQTPNIMIFLMVFPALISTQGSTKTVSVLDQFVKTATTTFLAVCMT
ncbi:MAG: hypothetical protein EOM51_04315 [Clostridia bacterium]|nr:hypothetical protein [Clostridia bacterium]